MLTASQTNTIDVMLDALDDLVLKGEFTDDIWQISLSALHNMGFTDEQIRVRIEQRLRARRASVPVEKSIGPLKAFVFWVAWIALAIFTLRALLFFVAS